MEKKVEDNLENEELSEEELKEMKNYFDKEIWPKMKRDLKVMTRKEACFTCFVAGSDMIRYSQEEELKEAKEKLLEMSEEEIESIIKGGINKNE